MPADTPVDPVRADPPTLDASLRHDEWCNAMRRAGWRYGPELDMPGLTHPELVPYAQLPPAVQHRYDTVPAS